mgnify:CR=1 FL=1
MPSTGMRTMADELDETVARAREHLLSAWTEGVEAARSLFEAAGIATERTEPTAGSATRSSAPPETDPLRAGLDDLVGALRRAGLLQPPPAMMQSLSEALEHEVRRWETRSRTDPEARLVLRAFLVLRELSWELAKGHRTPEEGGEAAPRTDAAARPTAGEPASPRPAARQRAQRRPRPAREPSATGARMPRVQRFDVEQG